MKRVFVPFACSFVLLGAGCSSTPPTPVVPPGSAVRAIPAEVQAPVNLDDKAFGAWLATHRTRVTNARAAAHQQFSEAEMACWHRFAVNDCLSVARADRRKVLNQLRDEELALNLQERQRSAAARLQQLGDKQRAADLAK